MLISRGLRTLLLGLTAAASVLNRHSPSAPGAQVQISRGEAATSHNASRQNAQRAPVRSRWTPTGSRWRRLRVRQELELACPQSNSSALSCPPNSTCCPTSAGGFSCCEQGSVCCLLEDGGTGCCPTPCEGGNCSESSSFTLSSTTSALAAADASTVFVTQTLTSTVTVFTGSPTTGVVTTTNTIVITLLDPTERTQTSTVTATSFFRAGKRTIGGLSQATGVERRQEQAFTSTVTAEVYTTVFRPSAILATITNTVFSTTFVAPNAVTTIIVTTTVFVPSGDVPPTSPPGTSPTAPGGSLTPVITSTGLGTTPSSASTSSPTTSLVLPTSRSSSTSSIVSGTMMMTMSGVMPTTTARPTPSATPIPATTPAFTVTQIVGIAVGSAVGLLVLILLILGFRRIVQRRRAAHAQMRQQLTPPDDRPRGAAAAMSAAPRRSPPNRGGQGGLAGGALATNGSGTSSSAASGPSNHSMLTGEGEVRIVIRPAPKRRTQSSQLWPMPPGHRGQTYSLFVEEATTGETTPQDPGAWSIASERGSVKDGREAANNNNTTVYSTGEYGERASGSGDRPTTSIFSAGWDRETSFGARSEGSSYPGLGTLLTPPPAWHGAATESRWPRDPADFDGNNEGRAGSSGNGEGSSGGGYQAGSLGIGKAW